MMTQVNTFITGFLSGFMLMGIVTLLLHKKDKEGSINKDE